MKLVVIESPNKIKSLTKYLGGGYKVMATAGHIFDLPQKELGIDVKNNFEPTYEISKDKSGKSKKNLLDDIVKAAATADEILIATDPDREGEAIGYHVFMALKKTDQRKVKRVKFHSITKDEVNRAIKAPEDLNVNLFNAQQTRRIIDRLVGYQVSPVMAYSGGLKGTSAGRVQSVALKYMAEREKEINAFKPEEYWLIDAVFNKANIEFAARYAKDLGNETVTKKVLADIEGKQFVVISVEEKETSSNPSPPFKTSTLQQAASTRFGWSGKKTMDVAQKLFEAGAITYHRTDSVYAEPPFIERARDAASKYGKEYLPPKAIVYANKDKNAQEAHECIRPTFEHEDDIDGDGTRLLDLVRRRFVASQMTPARFKTVTVTFENSGHQFVAKGRQMIFDGYQKVWGSDTEDVILPPLAKGEKLTAKRIDHEQKFTTPPPRFTDVAVTKQLEKDGVGRPSTYATIIPTLEARKYISKEGKTYKVTPLGIQVYDYLNKHFPLIVSPELTAAMEENLDKIANHGQDWVQTMQEWYNPFSENLKKAKSAKGEVVEGIKCPTCGKGVVRKAGKFGSYMACVDYPTCKTTLNLDKEGNVKVKKAAEPTDYKCPKCKSPMLKREGRFGPFLGCSGYPKCKELMGIPLGKCPTCKKGYVVEKYSPKKKSKFFGCSTYPKCEFVTDSKDDFKTAEEE